MREWNILGWHQTINRKDNFLGDRCLCYQEKDLQNGSLWLRAPSLHLSLVPPEAASSLHLSLVPPEADLKQKGCLQWPRQVFPDFHPLLSRTLQPEPPFSASLLWGFNLTSKFTNRENRRDLDVFQRKTTENYSSNKVLNGANIKIEKERKEALLICGSRDNTCFQCDKHWGEGSNKD